MTRLTLGGAALTAMMLIASSAQAQNQVTAEAWLDTMLNELPGFFCQDDEYFMQCFDVDQAECRTISKEQAQRCIDEMAGQLPALLNMPDDGRKWGSDLGRCAGIGYDLALAERKSASPRCNPSQ